MKRFLLTAVAVMLAACCAVATAQPRSPKRERSRLSAAGHGERRFETYGVAFYNLDNLFDTINSNGKYDLSYSPQGRRAWDGTRYRSKINHIATAIAAMKGKQSPDGPAVIGVCDVENAAVIGDLVSAAPLRERGLRFIHHDSPDRRGLDVALIYDPKAFAPVKVTNYPVRSAEFPEFRTRDIMLVSGMLGGEPVELIINQWPMPPGPKSKMQTDMRESAAGIVRSIVDSLNAANPKTGIIVMGNFNSTPAAGCLTTVLNAAGNPEDMHDDALFNPFRAMADRGNGTCFWHDTWYLPDEIMVNRALMRDGDSPLTLLRAKIIDDDFLLTDDERHLPRRNFDKDTWLDGYSSHLPVIAYFVKRKK